MLSGLLDLASVGDAESAADFLAGVLQASTEYAVIGLALDGTILLWNEGARRLYGYEPGEVVGRANAALLRPPGDTEAGRLHAMLAATLANAKWEGTPEFRRKNGESFTARVIITIRHDAAGKAAGFLMIASDITDEIRLTEELSAELEARALTEARLRESDERYRIITETVTDAIISIDEHGKIAFINTAAERIFGYRVREMLGQRLSMLIPGSLQKLRKATRVRHRMTGYRRVVWEETELSGLHKDGRPVPLEVSFGEYRRNNRRLFTGVVRDVTERKRADEKIRYLAQHDALTELPNRVLLRDRIAHALAQARRSHEKVAVLFLDLDGFKHINDSLGHHTGDHLLRMVSQRLRRCLREGDSIGRLGGDEFLVCLPAPVDEHDAAAVSGKILETLREPFQVDEQELHVSASIGISVFPADGEDTDTLMRAADIAMYHAKEKGRNNYQFFTPNLNKTARRRLLITSRLHRALQRDELTLVYQPQVEMENGRILAVEALIRWQQPGNGTILPDQFIKIAEEAGLVAPIGEWVLREACRQLKRWREAGHPDLRVAVNLSPEQFRRPGFADLVLGILRETGLPAPALDLEITEGVLMRQSRENIAIIGRLAGTGIQFAVDDFGTGYSNLAYLQRFPIDAIKIDRSFVDGLGRDRNNNAIVTAIIAMARNLNLHIVAEGVETAEQVGFLRSRGCLAAQGFYYHAPVPAEVFGALLDRQVAAMHSGDAGDNG